MPRHFVILSLSPIFSLLPLIFSSRTAFAVGTCRETPDYKSPLVSQLFTKDNMESKDCGIYSETSPLQEENIDYGKVRCLDRPELVAQLVGDPDFIQSTGNGRATLNIKDNANLALGSEVLIANEPELRPLLMAIQMASQGDRQIAASCYAEGYTDLSQCASALNLGVCNSQGDCRLNTFHYPQSSRYSTLRDQLLEIRERAIIHLNCTDGTVPTNIPCDNIFFYDEAGDKNSRELAQFIVAHIPATDPLEAYNALSPEDQLKVKSLMASKASEKYWIVIKKIPNPQNLIEGIRTTFTQNEQIFIIPRYLPSMPHIYDTAKARFRKVQPKGEGDTIVADLKQFLYQPVSHDQSLNAQILNKIDISGEKCTAAATEQQLSQFMGAVAPAGPERETILQWFFDIIGDTKNALNKTMYVYEIYTIVPYQLQILAQIEGEHSQSIERLFYPKTANQGFNQSINIPQPVNAQAPAASTNLPAGTQPCTYSAAGTCLCNSGYTPANGQCQLDESGQLVYSDQAPRQSFIPGGELTFLKRFYSEQKRFLPKNDKDYMTEKCQYYPALVAKVPLLGSILSSVTSAFVSLSTSCPAPPNNSSLNTSTDGKVRQHLFETTCGSVCYDYILSRTLSETSCKGLVLNPFIAIAIALNENGGLVSCHPGAKEPNHFGCDLNGAAGYDQTIEEKTSCMLNTLTNACRNGKSNEAILNQYGYSSLGDLSPLGVLGYTGNELFVSPATAKLNASSLRTILPTQKETWWKYYCPGYIAPYAASTCNQTIDCQ